MSVGLTLKDVQSLIAVSDSHAEARHKEVLDRLDLMNSRLFNAEQEIAGNRPLLKGVSGASAMLAAALFAGFIGSYFSGS